MRRLLSIAALNIVGVLLINGCGDLDTGDSSSTHNDYTSEYYYTENNIDYGSGTVLLCDDANCSVMKDESGRTVTSGGNDKGDATVGVYDPTYTQSECKAAGFFYCTVQDKCLNQRVDDSSSSCGK
jgi:hypothetical protein